MISIPKWSKQIGAVSFMIPVLFITVRFFITEGLPSFTQVAVDVYIWLDYISMGGLFWYELVILEIFLTVIFAVSFFKVSDYLLEKYGLEDKFSAITEKRR